SGMGTWLDRLGALLVDATLGTLALLVVATIAMVGCRQPSRRVILARGAILGSLAMIALDSARPLPRLDLVGQLQRIAPPNAHCSAEEPFPRPRRTGVVRRGVRSRLEVERGSGGCGVAVGEEGIDRLVRRRRHDGPGLAGPRLLGHALAGSPRVGPVRGDTTDL